MDLFTNEKRNTHAHKEKILIFLTGLAGPGPKLFSLLRAGPGRDRSHAGRAGPGLKNPARADL